MKKILIVSMLLSVSLYTSVNAATLTDTQIGARIDSIQGNIPAGVPGAPSGMDQKGYVGEMLANLFDGNNKIKGFFIQAFQSIWNTQANTLPRWNGQSFTAGTIRDSGTGVSIGGAIDSNYILSVYGPTNLRGNTNIQGDINFTGDLYNNGTLFTGKFIDGTNRQDAVFTGVGTRNVGIGTMTPTSKLEINGGIYINTTTPTISFQDSDTGVNSYITANSSNGSVEIGADQNNEIAGSKINLSVDGSTKMVVLGSGNVGIGTIDPIQKLDVNGKIRMREQTTASDSPDIVATKGYVDTKFTQIPICTGNNKALGWDGNAWICNSGVVGDSGNGGNFSNCALPWGGFAAHGQSVIAYSTDKVADDNCTTVREFRLCTNGVLSGSFRNQTCRTFSPGP